jgi:hypothetical protein
LILAPFDTIKTLQQHSRNVGSSSLTLMQAAQVIMKRPKGFLEFYVSVDRCLGGRNVSNGLFLFYSVDDWDDDCFFSYLSIF